MRQIILASNSPRRRDLLKILGIPFRIVASRFEEKFNPKLSPEKVVKQLAQGKAREVAGRFKHGIVIGGDTIVFFRGKILGKPKSKPDAFKMLKSLSGRVHDVYTGLAVIDSKTGKAMTTTTKTKIYLRKLADNEIKNYIATGEPMDKAGGYAGQSLGAVLIKKVEGDFFGLVGLSLHDLVLILKKFGVNIL